MARLRAALTWLGTQPKRARSHWRRSLRGRVVATTVALCLVVVALLGAFLVTSVKRGLLQAKLETALAEAGTGTASAQRQFDALDAGNAELRDRSAISIVERLSTGGGQAGRNDVLLVGSPSETAGRGPAAVDYTSGPATRDTLPADLRSGVQTGDGPLWTYLAMPVHADGDAADTEVPGLVVGERVFLPGAGPYELYYLFPLDQEQSTLGLIQRAVTVAGLLLVLLVGLVAWVVARQVVTPVRMAARIAQRLAAGGLKERMVVRGEDDLARLARSFNKMAASLERQISELENLSRVQQQFVSDVSHELRTPLTTVRMAADVLHEARDRSDPVLARSSELLQSQLEHFESLLTDLLEISRFDARAAVLDAEPHDVRALVRRVASAVEPLAVRRGSEVRLDTPAQPCIAEVDSRRIERILRNLVVNAIEHGLGKPVVISVAASDDTVAVVVADSGVGLDEGQAARVFDRFWRADPARARTTGGTGLGLSIALEEAHLHDGTLEAWGVLGQGSRFRLTLPSHAGTPAGESPLPLVVDARPAPLPPKPAAGAGAVAEPGLSPAGVSPYVPPSHAEEAP